MQQRVNMTTPNEQNTLEAITARPRLAKIGDLVVCKCCLPVPYRISMRLNTPASVAEVNADLLSDNPVWEFSSIPQKPTKQEL